MRTKINKKSFFTFAIVFAVLVISSFLIPTKTYVANAYGGSLEISGPNQISENSAYVEFTATLLGSNQFSPADIEWFFNDTQIINSATTGTLTLTSTLRLNQSYYYGEESAFVYAKILSGGTTVYEAKRQFTVHKESASVTLFIEGGIHTQNYNEAGNYNPFVFAISSPVITVQNVSWFRLETNGKYTPLSPQADKSKYTLNVSTPDKYTLIAKVDDTFSAPYTATILHKSITSLSMRTEVVGTNNVGFKIYKFTLQNLTEEHDLQNINWYSKSYNSTPLQFGGKEFIFEPTTYATYEIVARYEPTTQSMIESNSFSFEESINRTREIAIFSLTLIGIMAVGLVILIYRNIKKDRVW